MCCQCGFVGHELTVSYLGREDFAPAGARQALLQERFGFTCDCQRCRYEEGVGGQGNLPAVLCKKRAQRLDRPVLQCGQGDCLVVAGLITAT